MTLRIIPELQEGTYRAKASGTLPNGKPVVVNSDGTVSVVTGTNLTAENFIGFSTGGSVADGSSVTVDIIGTVNKWQSGLTSGERYYVQTDGTLGTTAGTPSVFAGTAIESTKLLVKG